jgi:hypothetical protein
MKTCKKCSETKDISLFYRDSKSKDERSNTCKSCKSKQAKNRRSLVKYRKREEIYEYARKRAAEAMFESF